MDCLPYSQHRKLVADITKLLLAELLGVLTRAFVNNKSLYCEANVLVNVCVYKPCVYEHMQYSKSALSGFCTVQAPNPLNNTLPSH